MYPGCRVGHALTLAMHVQQGLMTRNDTMEDLFKAGYKKDDILGALRILPFVRVQRVS